VARSAARYALWSGDMQEARDRDALTPEERDELAGRKK
jgi:hypothetical protein